jgi:hypothetical protein
MVRRHGQIAGILLGLELFRRGGSAVLSHGLCRRVGDMRQAAGVDRHGGRHCGQNAGYDHEAETCDGRGEFLSHEKDSCEGGAGSRQGRSRAHAIAAASPAWRRPYGMMKRGGPARPAGMASQPRRRAGGRAARSRHLSSLRQPFTGTGTTRPLPPCGGGLERFAIRLARILRLRSNLRIRAA